MNVTSPCDIQTFLNTLAPLNLRALLEQAGYRVVIRAATWTEALVTREQERWLGRGVTPDEALADVFHMLLPSAFARLLFIQRDIAPSQPLRPQPAAPPPRAPQPSIETEVALTPPSPQTRELPPALSGLTLVETAHAEATVAPLVAHEPPKPAVEPTKRPTLLKTHPNPHAGLKSAAPVEVIDSVLPPVSSRRSEEALAQLEELGLRLEALTQDIAWMSRPLQRMVITSFIARARHINTSNNDPKVMQATQSIAKRLANLATLLWPGSIPALKQEARPSVAFGSHDKTEECSKLQTWEDAALLAERFFEERRERSNEDYKSDWGWADTRYCNPGPNDPDMRLEQTYNAMRDFFGELHHLVPYVVEPRLQKADEELVQQLCVWARQLRWLRPHVEDRLRWASAFGRLRWACSRIPPQLRSELDPLLSESHIPPHAWASLLGEKPQQKLRQKLRKQVLQNMPQVPVEEERLIHWLTEAFNIAEALPINELAERVLKLASEIRSLQDSELIPNERRFRRSLASLVRYLDFLEHGTPLQEEEASETTHQVAEREDDIDEGARPFHALLHQVRERVKGKKALFISNRNDITLKERLQAELKFELEWSEIDPQRIKAKADSIRQGNYDIVLSATGFQGHDVDVRLSPAARSSNTPYVRVDRGRLNACVRAIARHYGLLQLDA